MIYLPLRSNGALLFANASYIRLEVAKIYT